MYQNNSPLVSIIIVTYNGYEYVKRCVCASLHSNYKNIEIIVVDNGSTDNTIKKLKKKFSDIHFFKVLALDKNYGPAYARNRASEIANGKYISFLDNDTCPHQDWLIPLVEKLELNPNIGACQCKLVLLKEPNRIDYVGDFLSPIGFLIQPVQGGDKDIGQAEEEMEILSAKSAGMVIRTKAFIEAGKFDNEYFIYVEETDLGWRVWLSGYKIIYVPNSIVYHELGTSELILGDKQHRLAKFHGTKNYITTLLKNCGVISLIKILPIHIFLWFSMAFWFLLKRKITPSYDILKGIAWVFYNIFSILKKRYYIQKNRHISDKELFKIVMKKAPFSYFIKKLVLVHKVGNATSYNQPSISEVSK